MFVKINETFFIKKRISQKKLRKCVSFISNQNNSTSKSIKKAYKINNSQIINFPNEINIKDIDIVIRTKFNQDYKYINLNKSKIFFKENIKIKSAQKKIKHFNIEQFKFYPKTYVLKNIVFQDLAKGSIYFPNNLSKFNLGLLQNIAYVIENLSSRYNSSIKISDYIIQNKFEKKIDNLNYEIIYTFAKLLKKQQNKKIKLALTHGDFKFEHLFSIKGDLEYVIDWESTKIRSVFFDLFNFFIPWFEKRSYSYFQLKKYVLNFINNYLPTLQDEIKARYDIYFSIYALERYKRIKDGRTSKFSTIEAHKRFNNLFKKYYRILKQKNLSSDKSN